MKHVFLALTAPLWLPILCAAGAASLVIGMAMVVMTNVLKDRPAPDEWWEGHVHHDGCDHSH